MREVGERLANFYDPATGGLFMRHPTDPAAQQELLSVLDEELGEEEQQRCEGPQGDGTITADEALTALRSLPRGKSPGSDGLTYEFYLAMWEVVGQPLVAAFNYAFSDPQRRLSERQRLGLIILIYKGGGKPRADPASYRPITLLNTDLKIVAKVMVLRFGPALESVIDSTQTAFVPGRDIADNVLLHLEEVDYVQGEQGQQGCILFLDFEKAYDRLDRDWVLRCMETMQFPGSSTRWVRLLLEGTCGQVMFNGGCTSRVFDIPSGCAQGSPLSPLLYVIAAQPLAAMCRTMQATGEAPGILLPDGSQAPPSHQHADDTTLHGRTVDSVRTLLRRAVLPFCAASGAKLNADKSQGMVLGAHPAMVGVDEETGVTFVDTTVTPIRHLGILLSENGATAFAQQLFEQRLRIITHRVRHWSKLKLSLLSSVRWPGRCWHRAWCTTRSLCQCQRDSCPCCSGALRPLRWAWGVSPLKMQARSCAGPLQQWRTCRCSGAASDMWTCSPTSRRCRPRLQRRCYTRTGARGSCSCTATWTGRCRAGAHGS